MGDRMLADAFGKHLADFRQQQLGIAEPANAVVRFENDGCGNDGSEQCATSDFVHASDELSAVRPGELFVLQSALELLKEAQLKRGHRTLLLAWLQQPQVLLC